MLFGVRQNLCKLPSIKIDFLGQEDAITLCKDLGIVLDPNLSFNDQILKFNVIAMFSDK